MVYFSVVHAFYFALKATDKGRCAVLEIDSTELDESKFHPDEDFVAQVLATHANTPLEAIHDCVRDDLEQYRHVWRSCLEERGSCCYKGTIPVSTISRVCLVDCEARPFLKEIATNPYNVDSLRFHLRPKGAPYTGLLAWLFGDTPELPDPNFVKYPVGESPPEMAAKIEQYRKESQDRTGIEVVPLSNFSWNGL